MEIIKKVVASSDITRKYLWFEGLVYIVYNMIRYDVGRYLKVNLMDGVRPGSIII